MEGVNRLVLYRILKLARAGPIDVAFAFNNELTSKEPSGIDVDDDGVVGTIEWSTFSDPDDS